MKIVFAMAAVIGLCALAADAPAALKKDRKKLLVVTHTTGFRHADAISCQGPVKEEQS